MLFRSPRHCSHILCLLLYLSLSHTHTSPLLAHPLSPPLSLSLTHTPRQCSHILFLLHYLSLTHTHTLPQLAHPLSPPLSFSLTHTHLATAFTSSFSSSSWTLASFPCCWFVDFSFSLCVAVFVAVCCSMLQCVAVCCKYRSVLQCIRAKGTIITTESLCCFVTFSFLFKSPAGCLCASFSPSLRYMCVAVCRSVMQCIRAKHTFMSLLFRAFVFFFKKSLLGASFSHSLRYMSRDKYVMSQKNTSCHR